MSENLLRLLAENDRGVLATLRRDGRPQMSTVAYHYEAERRTVAISVTEDRAKTRNLRRDPRAAFHVSGPGMGSYVVVEGIVELTPPASTPDGATADALVELYRAVAGEHPDWDGFRAAMVAERRLVLRVPVDHLYGWGGAG